MNIRTVYVGVDIRGDRTCAVFLKQIENAGQVIFSEPHRVMLETDADVEHMRECCDNTLVSLGYPATADADWDKIKAHRALNRT